MSKCYPDLRYPDLRRRSVLAAALAAGGFAPTGASAATSQQNDDTARIQDLIDGGKPIYLPEGTYRVTGDIVATRFTKLQLAGKLTGPGTIEFSAGCHISGTGTGTITMKEILLSAGNCTVQNLGFEDNQGTACILVGGNSAFDEVSVLDCRFERCNYGILRQGANSSITRAIIRGNTFRQLHGDAIEWNVATKDKNLLITNNKIESVNNTAAKPFWGIGIGVSGRSYTEDFSEADSVKDFVISNNVIRGVRQGIHVEAGKRFQITGNTVTDIAEKFSANSGLEVAGVVVYGSSEFVIQNNDVQVSAGRTIYCVEGATRDKYRNVCTDYSIHGNRCKGGPIIVSIGMDRRRVAIERNVADAPLIIYGRVTELVVRGNQINVPAGTKAFIADFDPVKGYGASYKSKNATTVNLQDNVFRDSLGRDAVTIKSTKITSITAKGNNFIVEIPSR